MINFWLLGFPVQIQPFFWLTCLLFGGAISASTTEAWFGVLNWTLVVFISIMVHELGHAIAGRRFGALPAIALHGLGGVTLLPGASFTRGQNILVSAAGPAAGFLLAAIFIAAYYLVGPTAPADIGQFIGIGIYINVFWTIFNLLPIQPLDGGQILRDLLGPKRFKLTCWIGAIMGTVLLIWALWDRQIFLAVFAAILAWSNFKGRVNLPGGVEK